MIYDRFQQEAIDCINQGYSVLVSAPTGAGKTAIAEHIITECITNNRGVIYTAPIKALSNQKFRDFKEQFRDRIGILTGDVSLNAQAPVLIMTTEILRNKILDEPESLRRYSWVIFDELHYIDNQERGTVWEESLIFLPTHFNILGLSATIPNIEQIGAWIDSTRKHNFLHRTQEESTREYKGMKIITEANRPVPLHFYFQCQNRIFERIEQLRKLRPGHKNTLPFILNHIRDKEGLPCIYFVFSRKRTEDLAFEMYSHDFLTPAERDRVIGLYEELLTRYDLTGERTAQMQACSPRSKR
jgi:ATP-dependent RNA helicase DOB1